jgi:hypothetical protein
MNIGEHPDLTETEAARAALFGPVTWQIWVEFRFRNIATGEVQTALAPGRNVRFSEWVVQARECGRYAGEWEDTDPEEQRPRRRSLPPANQPTSSDSTEVG